MSPWQVAHVLSIIHTLQGDLAPAWQPAAARSRSLQRRGSRLTYMTSSHLHFACTLDVPLLSAIVMVPLPMLPFACGLHESFLGTCMLLLRSALSATLTATVTVHGHSATAWDARLHSPHMTVNSQPYPELHGCRCQGR